MPPRRSPASVELPPYVALVWKDTPADADRVRTIDGNQGNPCIKRNERDMKAKVNNGNDFAVIFLHVLGVG